MFSSASRFALRAASRTALRTQQPSLIRNFAATVSSQKNVYHCRPYLDWTLQDRIGHDDDSINDFLYS